MAHPMTLAAIPNINSSIGSVKSPTIRLVHKFIFGTDDLRQNRANLRNFPGFTFKPDDAQFILKRDSAVAEFTKTELLKITNFFQLDAEGDKKDLIEILLSTLSDLTAFSQTFDANSDTEIGDTNSTITANMSALQIEGNSASTNTQNLSPLPPVYAHPQQSLPTDYLSLRSPIQFCDIEKLIPKFRGSKTDNIHTWLQRFETIATSFHITDTQKFLFVQRALEGVALLHVQSEPALFNYQSLRASLLAEFAPQVTAAHIHALLQARKCRPSETPLEYFFALREVASRISLDDQSLIHYVISGLNDASHNKSVLYGATNLPDFKKKLRLYEEISQSSTNFLPNRPQPMFQSAQRPSMTTNEDSTNANLNRAMCDEAFKSHHA